MHIYVYIYMYITLKKKLSLYIFLSLVKQCTPIVQYTLNITYKMIHIMYIYTIYSQLKIISIEMGKHVYPLKSF